MVAEKRTGLIEHLGIALERDFPNFASESAKHAGVVEAAIFNLRRPAPQPIDWKTVDSSVEYLKAIQSRSSIFTPAYIKGLRSEMHAGRIPPKTAETMIRKAIDWENQLKDILQRIQRLREGETN